MMVVGMFMRQGTFVTWHVAIWVKGVGVLSPHIVVVMCMNNIAGERCEKSPSLLDFLLRLLLPAGDG